MAAAALLGGFLALALLLALCLALDAVESLTHAPRSSETAVARSGDSSAGTSAIILAVYFGPLAFLFGAAALSFPVHHLLFRRGR